MKTQQKTNEIQNTFSRFFRNSCKMLLIFSLIIFMFVFSFICFFLLSVGTFDTCFKFMIIIFQLKKMYKTYNINTNDILDSKFKTLIFITVFEMGFQSSFIRILYLCSPSFKYLSSAHTHTHTHKHTHSHTLIHSFSLPQYMCSHLTLKI